MYKFKLSILAFGLIALISLSAQAADLDNAEDIIQRANFMSYYQGKDGRAQVTMTITDSQNRERARKLTILRLDGPETDTLEGNAYRGDQKFYVYFHRPADVSKMVFMVWKHLEQDDDRWLYLPALDLVKRIAASDRRASFVGSDFLYEDVSGRLLEDDSHELLETTEQYYKMRHTPKNPGSVEFAYFETFIHKQTFLPVQAVYYDDSGNKVRTISVNGVETIQGHPTVTKSTAENHQTGSKTVMEYSSVVYDTGLPDDIFSERYLRKAPKKHLR